MSLALSDAFSVPCRDACERDGHDRTVARPLDKRNCRISSGRARKRLALFAQGAHTLWHRIDHRREDVHWFDARDGHLLSSSREKNVQVFAY